VSMLPPQAPGVSDERTSPRAGATPTVPCMGPAAGPPERASPARRSARPQRSCRSRTPTSARQRVLQHRRERGGRQRPEQRHRGAHPSRLTWRDAVEVHGEGVAGLCPFDEERARLRVEETRVADLRHQVRRRPHPPGEAVQRPGRDHGARPDAHQRLEPAERVRQRRRVALGVRLEPEQLVVRRRGHAIPLSAFQWWDSSRSRVSSNTVRPIEW
jgi:hypothetical protein